LKSDVHINRYSRTLGSSAECLHLAVLTVPSEVGDQGTAKMPLTRQRVQNRWIGGFWNDKEVAFITRKNRWVI